MQANLGESENYGYELAISGLIIKNQDWLWRVSANTHHTVNKLTKISNSLMKQTEENMAAEGMAPKILFKEGESTTAIFAVRSLGCLLYTSIRWVSDGFFCLGDRIDIILLPR